MRDYISDRAVLLAEYMIEKKATVRQTAKKFNISKSTVHKDVSERLRKIDKQLFDKVNQVLKVNKAERHIRGGLATKHKYEEAKKQTDKAYVG